MKVAIPTANGKLAMHFGHCQQFEILTVDPESKTISGCESMNPPPHEPGVLPKWIGEQGVNLIIAGGMGNRAQQLFAKQNIQVIVGAPTESSDDLVKAWMDGTLVSGANACDH
jgi:predicted Fe-Mo cluster-binding NifX family protein